MLFSDEQIANRINTAFEPVWQSVRPVPIVRIDFGNGNVLTRTLHGNIATYLCNAEGQVLDILPGIYEPADYLKQLDQFALLSRYARPERDNGTRLAAYHTTLAADLEKHRKPSLLLGVMDVSKMRIEGGLKVILRPSVDQTSTTATAAGKTVALSNKVPDLSANADVSNWQALVDDTHLNENERRLSIHRMLADRRLARPADVTKWLYREVLHADLDDPYLGLGPTLFGAYPFKDDISMKP